MTHYYLYIAAGLQIDANTRFYKVGIGESEAQRKKLAWLEAYAFEHGHYFVRWDIDAVEFCVKAQNSIGMEHPDVRSLMANDLCRVLQTGCEEPAFYQSALNRHRLMMAIDPNYYAAQVIKSRLKNG